MKKKTSALTLKVTMTLLLFAVAATSYGYGGFRDKKLLVFGDSLVDVGNLPPLTFLTPGGDPGLVIPPPTRYDRGRFVNGRNVGDFLATRFGTYLKPSNSGYDASDSVSFAHGGSGTGTCNLTPGLLPVPGLLGQAQQFVESLGPGTQIGPRTLIMIWAGANDYLLAPLALPPPEGCSGIVADPVTVVGNHVDAISLLYTRGARKFVVLNLPNLGKTPICLDFNGESVCEPLTMVTQVHNELLKVTLDELPLSLENVKLVQVDAYKIFEEVTNHPERFGFSPDVQSAGPAAGCLFQPPPFLDPANCAGVDFTTDMVFWDEEHPTEEVHRLMADGVVWGLLKSRFANPD